MSENSHVALKSLITEALKGEKSVRAIAVSAGIEQSKLRNALIRDPRYPEAVKAGKVATKEFRTALQWRESELVKSIIDGKLTYAQAANKYDVTEATIRNRVRKAYPDGVPSNREPNRVSGPINETNNDIYMPPSISPVSKSGGLLPVIAWDTARDWNPAEGPIQDYDVQGWMAAARPHTPHSYVLKVEDNSMTAVIGAPRSFPEGCLIFVDAGLTEFQPGDRVIARLTETDDCVFRIYRRANGKEWLEALNSAYEVIRDPFTLVGKVFGKWEDA